MEALSVMIKPVSGRCNLACAYCFYRDLVSLRAAGDCGEMALDTLEMIVQKALLEAKGHCSFLFQGGEPMLRGLDFFRAFVSFQQKYNLHGISLSNALQTNGTLIDDEWAAFFRQNGFLVGISLDGTEESHDLWRKDPAGKGTHSGAIRGLRILQKHGVECHVLSVVTQQLAEHPVQAYSFCRELGISNWQFIPCLDGFARGRRAYSLEPTAYGQFLCQVFDLWYADLRKGRYLSIRLFDNWVRLLLGEPPENCAMRGFCEAYPLVEADGSVYPCDFYAMDEYRLGNIQTDSLEKLLRSKAAQRFAELALPRPQECEGCEYGWICRGGCRRERGEGEGLSLNRFCESQRMFFRHALPRLREVAAWLSASSQPKF